MKTFSKYCLVGAVISAANAATVVQGWDSSIDFGVTLTRGNSETTLVTSTLALSKIKGQDEYNAGLAYSFGDDGGSVITDEITGFFNWNRLATDTTYYGFRLEGRRDDIAEIDYRFQGTLLYGIYAIKNDKTTLAFEGGPGYTVESLDGEDKTYPHFYIGQRASHWMTDNTKLFQSLAAYGSLEDFSDHNLIFTLGVESMMNESLSLKVILEDKYQSEPADGAKQNDLKLISGISYKF